jgi:hypothetical protein
VAKERIADNPADEIELGASGGECLGQPRGDLSLVWRQPSQDINLHNPLSIFAMVSTLHA